MDFVSSLGGGDGLRVEEALGEGFVRLRISEAERRQAKHDIRCVEDAVIELLRNARDADAAHVFVATSAVGNVRDLLVFDDGCGIPQGMQTRVFEARVTSKLDSMHMDQWGVHGRGMALYSIRENAQQARVIASGRGLGSAFGVTFDTNAITERADQSTWPTVVSQDGGQTLRGPHNIIRTCVEFGLASRDRCKVYVGSPSEVVATMRARMQPAALLHGAAAATDLAGVPVAQRVCFAHDARALREVADALGIKMSERTAHRIIRNEIKPLQNVCATVMPSGNPQRVAAPAGGMRKVVLADSDRREFARLMARDFSFLGDRYYLELLGEPRVRLSEGRLTVTFDYADED